MERTPPAPTGCRSRPCDAPAGLVDFSWAVYLGLRSLTLPRPRLTCDAALRLKKRTRPSLPYPRLDPLYPSLSVAKNLCSRKDLHR